MIRIKKNALGSFQVVRINFLGVIIAFLSLLLLIGVQPVFPTIIALDFGDTQQPNFNNNSPYTMYFADVANDGLIDIDATLVADGPWDAFKSTVGGTTVPPGNQLQWPHGSVNGDIRVFADQGQTISFTLSLWDGTNGLYDTGYNPGAAYEWNLAFYDIDSSPLDTYYNWDEVTLKTPGTYTVSSTTDLTITSIPGYGVNFSGDGVGGVAGQAGLQPPLTAAQQDVMVLFNVLNRNSVQFDYIVGYSSSPPDDSLRGRNFLIDGGSLSTAIDDPVTGEVPVPEPGTMLLLGSGLLGFVGYGRLKIRRKKK